jgi:hypothetical protein
MLRGRRAVDTRSQPAAAILSCNDVVPGGASGRRGRQANAGRSAPSRDPYPSIDAIAARAHELFVADGRRLDRLSTYWDLAAQQLLDYAASRTIAAHGCPRSPFE